MKLYDSGVYLVNGHDIVEEGSMNQPVSREEAARNTMAYGILEAHNTSGNMEKLQIKFDVQYLRRNNAYTVVIKDVLSQGADTPDEAYGAGSFGIRTVTVPTDWKVPDGIVTPPDVEVN